MGNPKNNIQLQGSAVTNVGRVRSHNEDNVHLWSEDGLVLAIVADGMGGAAAGEEASRIAVETITSNLGMDARLSSARLDVESSQLSSAVQDANLCIIDEALTHPKNKGMGTTLTMVYIREQMARFAHVGDSRAYRVNKHGQIEQITSDHSFVQALLDAGHITEEQAETHPMGNVLYRALGQTRDLDIDTYDAQLYVGDRLILCSDGLTRHVRSSEIAKIASEGLNSDTISHNLVNLANERGGEDNISVIVVIVDGEEDTDQKRERILDDDETVILKSSLKKDSASKLDTHKQTPYAQNTDSHEYVDHPPHRESQDPDDIKTQHVVRSPMAQTGELRRWDSEGKD